MRRGPCLLLALAALTVLSGCVWLRLLSLRDQFADFDRAITVPDGPGIELRFRRPVLLAEDLATLIKARPTATVTLAETTVQSYAFVHITSEQGPDPRTAAAQLILTATIRGGRVTAVELPPEVFRAIPRAVALRAMRALGKAQVDQGNRSASTQVDLTGIAAPLPTRLELIQLFGLPNSVHREIGRDRLLWRFRLVGESLRSDGQPVVAAIALAFPAGSDRPTRFQANISGLWLYLDLPPAVATPPVGPATPRPLPATAAPDLPEARPAGR